MSTAPMPEERVPPWHKTTFRWGIRISLLPATATVEIPIEATSGRLSPLQEGGDAVRFSWTSSKPFINVHNPFNSFTCYRCDFIWN